jgi:hypothetical protein
MSRRAEEAFVGLQYAYLRMHLESQTLHFLILCMPFLAEEFPRQLCRDLSEALFSGRPRALWSCLYSQVRFPVQCGQRIFFREKAICLAMVLCVCRPVCLTIALHSQRSQCCGSLCFVQLASQYPELHFCRTFHELNNLKLRPGKGDKSRSRRASRNSLERRA